MDAGLRYVVDARTRRYLRVRIETAMMDVGAGWSVLGPGCRLAWWYTANRHPVVNPYRSGQDQTRPNLKPESPGILGTHTRCGQSPVSRCCVSPTHSR